MHAGALKIFKERRENSDSVPGGVRGLMQSTHIFHRQVTQNRGLGSDCKAAYVVKSSHVTTDFLSKARANKPTP